MHFAFFAFRIQIPHYTIAAANESPDWECSSLPDVSADVLEVSLDADASVEAEITNEPGDSDNAPKDMEAVRSALKNENLFSIMLMKT